MFGVGETVILLTFAGSLSSPPPNYSDALNTSRRAIMEYPSTKSDIDRDTQKLEKFLTNNTGLHKEQLVYALYVSPLVTHTITTKPFKGLQVDLGDGFHLRPEVEYHFNDHLFTAGLFIVKGF